MEEYFYSEYYDSGSCDCYYSCRHEFVQKGEIMARPKTKTSAQSVTAYIKKTYDRIEAKVDKETSAKFKALCDKRGTNPNRLINEWIRQFIEKSPVE